MNQLCAALQKCCKMLEEGKESTIDEQKWFNSNRQNVLPHPRHLFLIYKLNIYSVHDKYTMDDVISIGRSHSMVIGILNWCPLTKETVLDTRPSFLLSPFLSGPHLQKSNFILFNIFFNNPLFALVLFSNLMCLSILLNLIVMDNYASLQF